ncbi:MAG: MIT C-terminal domain-containing protein [Sodaliphilus sp.]
MIGGITLIQARGSIEFTYKFEADYNRAIILNNGWTINLSRELDISENFDRFSIAASRQTGRRCCEFTMPINENSNVKYLY